MSFQRFAFRPLAVAACICAAGTANATITFFSSASGVPFTSGSVDRFSDLPVNADLQSLSLTRSAGSLRYTLGTTFGSADFSSLFSVPVAGTIGVSTGFFSDSLVFSILSTPVLAFGGNFFGSNILGEAVATALTITVTDVAGLTRTQLITNAGANTFSGFVSDVPLRFAAVALTTPNTNVFATVDNVVLSAVPEPGTWLMLLGGSAALLAAGVRRRG